MLKKFLLNLFFPQFCLGCGKEGSLICKDCLSLIEISEYQYCPFCNPPKRVFDGRNCPTHQRMKLNGLFAATSYQNSLVKKLITSFKYEPFLKTLKGPLAFLIIAHFLLSENKIIQEEPENSLLIPIPLSPFKRRWRGFNQSEEIAQELSTFFKIPLFYGLIKIKKTQPQVELKREERIKNIQGAFKVREPAKIRRKRIFLVDDVFTTGSTMEEAARVLKIAGAREVWGIVVAREILSD